MKGKDEGNAPQFRLGAGGLVNVVISPVKGQDVPGILIAPCLSVPILSLGVPRGMANLF